MVGIMAVAVAVTRYIEIALVPMKLTWHLKCVDICCSRVARHCLLAACKACLQVAAGRFAAGQGAPA